MAGGYLWVVKGYINDEKAYYAFKIYDMDNDGYISMSDLYDTLRKVFSIKQSEHVIHTVFDSYSMKYEKIRTFPKPYEGVSLERN